MSDLRKNMCPESLEGRVILSLDSEEVWAHHAPRQLIINEEAVKTRNTRLSTMMVRWPGDLSELTEAP